MVLCDMTLTSSLIITASSSGFLSYHFGMEVMLPTEWEQNQAGFCPVIYSSATLEKVISLLSYLICKMEITHVKIWMRKYLQNH